MLAGTLDWQSDSTCVVYLPGVGRSELRNAEECPRALQPLVELIRWESGRGSMMNTGQERIQGTTAWATDVANERKWENKAALLREATAASEPAEELEEINA